MEESGKVEVIEPQKEKTRHKHHSHKDKKKKSRRSELKEEVKRIQKEAESWKRKFEDSEREKKNLQNRLDDREKCWKEIRSSLEKEIKECQEKTEITLEEKTAQLQEVQNKFEREKNRQQAESERRLIEEETKAQNLQENIVKSSEEISLLKAENLWRTQEGIRLGIFVEKLVKCLGLQIEPGTDVLEETTLDTVVADVRDIVENTKRHAEELETLQLKLKRKESEIRGRIFGEKAKAQKFQEIVNRLKPFVKKLVKCTGLQVTPGGDFLEETNLDAVLTKVKQLLATRNAMEVMTTSAKNLVSVLEQTKEVTSSFIYGTTIQDTPLRQFPGFQMPEPHVEASDNMEMDEHPASSSNLPSPTRSNMSLHETGMMDIKPFGGRETPPIPCRINTLNPTAPSTPSPSHSAPEDNTAFNNEINSLSNFMQPRPVNQMQAEPQRKDSASSFKRITPCPPRLTPSSEPRQLPGLVSLVKTEVIENPIAIGLRNLESTTSVSIQSSATAPSTVVGSSLPVKPPTKQPLTPPKPSSSKKHGISILPREPPSPPSPIDLTGTYQVEDVEMDSSSSSDCLDSASLKGLGPSIVISTQGTLMNANPQCPNKEMTCDLPTQGHCIDHSWTNPWRCVCGKTYIHKSALKIHIRKLTQEWKFNCESCGKKFFHNHELQKHHHRRENNNVPVCLPYQKGTTAPPPATPSTSMGLIPRKILTKGMRDIRKLHHDIHRRKKHVSKTFFYRPRKDVLGNFSLSTLKSIFKSKKIGSLQTISKPVRVSTSITKVQDPDIHISYEAEGKNNASAISVIPSSSNSTSMPRSEKNRSEELEEEEEEDDALTVNEIF